MKKTDKLIAIFAAVMVVASSFFVCSAESAASGLSEMSGGTLPEASTACLPDGQFELVTLDDVADGQPIGNIPGRKRLLKAAGNTSMMPLLVIVIGFTDTPYSDSYNWGRTIFSAAASDWSLHKYYLDNSQGQFTFAPAQESSEYNKDGNTNTEDAANDGIVHVTVNIEHGNWVNQGGNGETFDPDLVSWREALAEAMTAADEYVDFSRYDADGDGAIETNEMALSFVVAGGEAANPSNLSYTSQNYLTWAHAWRMSAFMDSAPVCDGKKVNDYIALGEDLVYQRYKKAGTDEEYLYTKQAGVYSLAHELGHYLGLPDFYNTSTKDGAWRDYEVGRISIMADGPWCSVKVNGEDVIRPCAFDACSRVALRWVEPVKAEPGGTYEVTAQNYEDNSGYSVLMIPTDNDGEYYLVENRQFKGWDEGLAGSYPNNNWTDKEGKKHNSSYAENGGLVFWHVDENILDRYEPKNMINTLDHRPGYMPTYMEHDGDKKFKFIGTTVETTNLFFDEGIYSGHYAASAGQTIFLPTYSTTKDLPAARKQNEKGSGITLEGSGDSINVTLTSVYTEPEAVDEPEAETVEPTNTETISKQEKGPSTMIAAASSISIKASSLRKKAKKRTAVSVVQNKGAVTYQLVSAKKGGKSYKKKIKVDPYTGQVILKKNLGKGTYKIKVNVTDAGDETTNGATQTVTFKVRVK